jgi:hypothetical protein
MGSGGQANNEDVRFGIAEAGNRFAPIDPIAIGEAFHLCDFLTVGA